MMRRPYVVFLTLVTLIQAVFAIGFIIRPSFATELWVFPDTSGLSFLFIGSIFAAAAASTLWCIWSREYGALVGIALDYLTILIPLSILSFQIAGDRTPVTLFGIVCVLGVLFGAVLLALSIRIPIRDTRSQPMPVRIAFVIFIITLLIVGGSLILKNNVLPWVVTPEGGVIYGWMFLGALVYFLYAMLRPSWGNSAGQLVGFLAYDLVLVIAFVTRFTAPIPPEYVTAHVIYTLVVIGSGLLAFYYLILDPMHRIFPARAAAM
jgi:hypothetical protein